MLQSERMLHKTVAYIIISGVITDYYKMAQVKLTSGEVAMRKI